MAFQKKTAVKTVVAPKAVAMDAAVKEEVLTTAKKAVEKPDVTLKGITDLQLDLATRLAVIQGEFAAKIKELAQLDQAVALKEAEVRKWDEFKDAILDLDTLRAQIANEKLSADAAKQERDAAWAISEQDRLEDRVREEALYATNLKADRAQAEAEYNAKRAEIERTHKDQDILRERTFTEREGNLKAREKELLDLQAQVAKFPETLKAAEAAAESRMKNILTGQFNQEKALAAKDAESARMVSEINSKTQAATITSQAARIAQLETQLGAANEKVAAMAMAVADSNSGKAALAAVQETMASQNQPQNGKR